MKLKKLISIVLINSFLFSFVYGNSIAEILLIKKTEENNNVSLFKDFDFIKEYGKAVKSYIGKERNKIIINIQNIQDNSVQKNIINILDNINKKYNIDVICLEGIYDVADTDWFFKKLKDSKNKDIVLNKLLESNILSGTEYYFFKNTSSELLKNVEDKELYLYCLNLYEQIKEQEPYTDLILSEIEKSINVLLNNKKIYIKESRTERELLFIKNFIPYLTKYLKIQVNKEEYEYYRKNIKLYTELYNKYIDNKVLSLLNKSFLKADEFYEKNFERHELFIDNVFNLHDKKENSISIIITNPFFSSLSSDVFEINDISYIEIVPNNSKDIINNNYLISEESPLVSVNARKRIFSFFKKRNNNNNKEIINKNKIKKIKNLIAVAKILESDDSSIIRTLLALIKKNIDVNLIPEIKVYLLGFINLKKLGFCLINNINLDNLIVSSLIKFNVSKMPYNFMLSIKILYKLLFYKTYYNHYIKKGLLSVEEIENRINDNVMLSNEISLEQLKNRDFNGKTFKYIIGFTTFFDTERGVKDEFFRETQIEQYLNVLINKYGKENILIVSKAIDLGGIFNVYNLSSRLGLKTLGIISENTLNKYKNFIMGCDYYRITDSQHEDINELGDESAEFVDLIDELFVFGGEEVSANEIKSAADKNKKIILFTGIKKLANTFGQAEMSYESLTINGKQKIQNRIEMLQKNENPRKSQKTELESSIKSLNFFKDYNLLNKINKLIFIDDNYVKNYFLFCCSFLKSLCNKTNFLPVHNLNNIIMYKEWFEQKNSVCKAILINSLLFGVVIGIPKDIISSNLEEIKIFDNSMFLLNNQNLSSILPFTLSIAVFFVYSVYMFLNCNIIVSIVNNYALKKKIQNKDILLITEDGKKFNMKDIKQNNVILTSTYDQMISLKKYTNNLNNIYYIRILDKPNLYIRGGFLVDETENIRMKMDRQYNSLVFYSKKSLSLKFSDIKRYIFNLYLNGYRFENLDVNDILFVKDYEIV